MCILNRKLYLIWSYNKERGRMKEKIKAKVEKLLLPAKVTDLFPPRLLLSANRIITDKTATIDFVAVLFCLGLDFY